MQFRSQSTRPGHRSTRRTKTVRFLTYFASTYLHRGKFLQPILRWATNFAMSRAQGSKTFDGLRIIPHMPYDLADLVEVTEALKLIQNVDPRRYLIVKTNIRTIVLAGRKPKTLARYTPGIKECQLGQVPVPENARFAPAYCYAQALIHEATHGRLCSHCIPHTKSTKKRVEKACHKEEQRFLQKVADTNWSRWEVYTAYIDMITEHKHAGPQVRFLMTR